MKVILSPSKTQDFSKPLCKGNEKLKFQEISSEIYVFLKEMSLEDIVKAYNISDKLALEVKDMIDNYEIGPCSRAINSYTGSVYREIRLDTYSEDELKFLNEHVRILSAFYGVLSPFDLIRPYRLDMKTKIDDLNLKAIWKEKYTEEFKDEDLIINLASKEFSSLIKRDFINVEFKDFNGEKYLVKGTYAKTARGKMINQIVKNKIETIEDIKEIQVDNYKYNEDISTENNLVFTRKAL